MTERWHLRDTGHVVDEFSAAGLFETRASWRTMETVFESDAGRSITLVTNERRTLLRVETRGQRLRLRDVHAAPGRSHGFSSVIGDVDDDDDCDTVPNDIALEVLSRLIETGELHPRWDWVVEG